MLKKEDKKIKLSQELLYSLDQYIKEKYVPEESGSGVYKSPEFDGASFDADEIELKDGVPTFSKSNADDGEQRISSDVCGNLVYSGSAGVKRKLDNIIENAGETFQQRLLRLIDEKGYKDPEVYNRANVDRKLFSKIRKNKNYVPKKNTVIAFALALRLNLDEATDLLKSAGMALSPGSKGDLIVEYCIQNGIYNILTVNELLDQYGQPTLG